MAIDQTRRTKSQKPRSPQGGSDVEVRLLDDMLEYFKAYTRQNPETAALVCIGIGFVLGWKLKPW